LVDEPDAAQVDRLREANARLRDVIDRQAGELDEARRDNQALRAKVDELSVKLKELAARLGRNAKNSSVPPSSEGLAKKPATPRKRGGRRGKQPGSPGRIWRRSPTPTGVVEHTPAACAGCGGDLARAAVVSGAPAGVRPARDRFGGGRAPRAAAPPGCCPPSPAPPCTTAGHRTSPTRPATRCAARTWCVS